MGRHEGLTEHVCLSGPGHGFVGHHRRAAQVVLVEIAHLAGGALGDTQVPGEQVAGFLAVQHLERLVDVPRRGPALDLFPGPAVVRVVAKGRYQRVADVR